jgi:hypothetical protein
MKIDAEAVQPLAYPELFSEGEQSVARDALRKALRKTEQDAHAEYRARHREPAQLVTAGTDHPVDDEAA